MNRVGILAVGLALVACTKAEKKEESPAMTGTTTIVATPPTASASTLENVPSAPKSMVAATVAKPDGGSEVQVEADFADEASKDISPDTMESELGKLEKEIAEK